MTMWWVVLCFWICTSWLSIPPVSSQAVFQDASNSTCQGVLMHYQVQQITKIPPFLEDSADQPYRFQALLTLMNMGFDEVKNWQAYIGFQHREWLVGAPGTVLADGEVLPAAVPNGTIIAGFPSSNLLNAIETAGDPTKISVSINLTGTEFGVAPPDFPLPKNISFPVNGYTCGSVEQIGNDTLQLCCAENATAANLTASEQFLPLEQGDITISYSVTQTFPSNYLAEVEISNDDPLGRIDGWNLTWEWKQGEFIYQMRGAQTLDQDQADCLNGPAGEFYKDPSFDFSKVMSCNRIPTITDLPLDKAADQNVGNLPSCCRNGLLLPKIMNPSSSKSVFQLLVFKVPPNADDRDALDPPANFNIGSRFRCGQPRLVAPIDKPDPSSPTRMLSPVKSWQVTCNRTDAPRGAAGGLAEVVSPAAAANRPSCCVSFSGFYNTSVVPCPTCACGCTARGDIRPQCSADSPAMLIPSYALLSPFENRTTVADDWARANRMPVPRVRPCGDNCGVNINWHVASDFTDGWSARISVLNWGGNVSDWFAAVELGNAMPGFERIFTLNGTKMDNRTLYIQGMESFSDFLLEAQPAGKGKINPGKVQAVIAFEKKHTPRINITGGDGFPTKVIFNGQECVLPEVIPASSYGFLRSPSPFGVTVLAGLLLLMLLLG